jgi:hypothetical protein
MELPFAVDYGSNNAQPPSTRENVPPMSPDDESLVTASSQGSLVQSESDFKPIPRLVSAPPQSHSTTVSTATHNINQHTVNTRTHYPQVQEDYEDDGLAEVLSQYGVATPQVDTEFTYVNICEPEEDDLDIGLTSNDMGDDAVDFINRQQMQRGDTLALLLSGSMNGQADEVLQLTEQANQAVAEAAQAKKDGNLQIALNSHAAAANHFRNAATALKTTDGTYTT